MTTKAFYTQNRAISRLMLATTAALLFLGGQSTYASTNCSGSGTSSSCTISGSQSGPFTVSGSGSGQTLTVASGGVITANQSTKALIVSGSDWTIDIQSGANVKQNLSNHAIDVTGNNTVIKNAGTVSGGWYGINIEGTGTKITNTGSIGSYRSSSNRSGGVAIAISGDNTEVNNQSGATVSGNYSAIRIFEGKSGTQIQNSGSITSATEGVSVSGTNSTITNNAGGQITGSSAGISLDVKSSQTTIKNTGTIASNTMGIKIQSTASGNSIVNNAGSDGVSGGTISGGTHGIQVLGTGKLATLNNSGTIVGVWNGVSVEGSGSISSIVNTGTIKATNGSGRAIYLAGSATVDTILVTDSGLLSGNRSVYLQNGSASIGELMFAGSSQVTGAVGVSVGSATNSIQNISITDQASFTTTSHAIENAGTIQNLFIGSTVKSPFEDSNGNDVGDDTTTQSTVVVSGGGAGIRNTKVIDVISITNSATLSSTSNGLQNDNKTNAKVGSLLITSGGQLVSAASGIWNTGEITTIRVLGTAPKSNLATDDSSRPSAISGKNGIANDGKISTIEVKDGGQITGTGTGVQNTGTIDVIHVGSGSMIGGQTYGINNTGTISGIIVDSGGQISGGTNSILNQGTITSQQDNAPNTNSLKLRIEDSDSAISCEGVAICVVGADTSIGSILNQAKASGSGNNQTFTGGLVDGDIYINVTKTSRSTLTTTGIDVVNASNSTIDGSVIGRQGSIASVNNAGTITGNIDIEASSSQTVTLTNTNAGGIQGQIIFNGADASSTLKIQTWNTNVSTGEDGQPTFKHVNIQGTKGQVQVDSVVVTGVDGDVAKGSIDVKNVFSYEGYTEGQHIDVNSVRVSDALAGAGWSGNYDKASGIFQTDFSTERSAGGIMGQTLVGQLTRRDFFLDSVLTQASADALYNRIKDGNEGMIFAKPYVSFDSFDFSGNKVSGDTVGGIIGATGFITSHIITGFIGFEKTSLDSRFVNARMQLDSSSVYGGASIAHVITSNEKVDTFGRLTAKVAYTRTDVDRDLNAELSHGSTDTLSYGGDAQFGMNFKITPVSRIVPMLGVGYSAGQTDDYAMENSVSLKDSYKPGGVDIPYVVGSVTWHQVWMDYLRSYFTAGVRYNLKTEQKSTAVFDGAEVSGSYELPDYYEYVSAAINMKLSRHSEFSYGYTGVFDKTGESHNLLVQYKFLF